MPQAAPVTEPEGNDDPASPSERQVRLAAPPSPFGETYLRRVVNRLTRSFVRFTVQPVRRAGRTHTKNAGVSVGARNPRRLLCRGGLGPVVTDRARRATGGDFLEQ